MAIESRPKYQKSEVRADLVSVTVVNILIYLILESDWLTTSLLDCRFCGTVATGESVSVRGVWLFEYCAVCVPSPHQWHRGWM